MQITKSHTGGCRIQALKRRLTHLTLYSGEFLIFRQQSSKPSSFFYLKTMAAPALGYLPSVRLGAWAAVSRSLTDIGPSGSRFISMCATEANRWSRTSDLPFETCDITTTRGSAPAFHTVSTTLPTRRSETRCLKCFSFPKSDESELSRGRSAAGLRNPSKIISTQKFRGAQID